MIAIMSFVVVLVRKKKKLGNSFSLVWLSHLKMF